MADKLASRISVGLLAAVAISLGVLPVHAMGYGAGMSRSGYIPGTTAGYPIGTMSAGQYSNMQPIGRQNGVDYRDAGPWWWYGGGDAGYGGYGGGIGYGAGGFGVGDTPNGTQIIQTQQQPLYPTADGPMPTTTPHPDYATEATDNLATRAPDLHNSGPSMSLTPDDMHMPKVSSYFKGFWQDMQMGQQLASSQADGQMTSQQATGQVVASNVAPHTATAGSFQPPVVQSRLSSVNFRSGTAYAVRTELKPKLQEAEQQFQDLKAQGKIGTFDVQPLETQWADLKRRATEIDKIQNSVEQRAEEGKLINDISDFEYQLKQHVDN